MRRLNAQMRQILRSFRYTSSEQHIAASMQGSRTWNHVCGKQQKLLHLDLSVLDMSVQGRMRHTWTYWLLAYG